VRLSRRPIPLQRDGATGGRRALPSPAFRPPRESRARQAELSGEWELKPVGSQSRAAPLELAPRSAHGVFAAFIFAVASPSEVYFARW
jgi:hypothetical protein